MDLGSLEPICMCLSSESDARKYKSQHGGRVFVSNDGSLVVWFNPRMTPTKILLHPMLYGHGGQIT